MGCGIMFPRDFCQDSAGERRVASRVCRTLWCREQPAHVLLFSRASLSDEADDWDFDASPKPNEVQNDMYVRDEEEEEEEEAEAEAEDSDARKVVVRWRQ